MLTGFEKSGNIISTTREEIKEMAKFVFVVGDVRLDSEVPFGPVWREAKELAHELPVSNPCPDRRALYPYQQRPLP